MSIWSSFLIVWSLIYFYLMLLVIIILHFYTNKHSSMLSFSSAYNQEYRERLGESKYNVVTLGEVGQNTTCYDYDVLRCGGYQNQIFHYNVVFGRSHNQAAYLLLWIDSSQYFINIVELRLQNLWCYRSFHFFIIWYLINKENCDFLPISYEVSDCTQISTQLSLIAIAFNSLSGIFLS